MFRYNISCIKYIEYDIIVINNKIRLDFDL
jgi:hypothetical protein